MDIATLLATCGLSTSQAKVLAAMAAAWLAASPFNVTDTALATLRGQDELSSLVVPESAREAAAMAETVVAQGGFPVAGFVPIPVLWVSGTPGEATAALAQPCTSAGLASKVLEQLRSRCEADSIDSACVLDGYGAVTGLGGLSQAVRAGLGLGRGISRAALRRRAPVAGTGLVEIGKPDGVRGRSVFLEHVKATLGAEGKKDE